MVTKIVCSFVVTTFTKMVTLNTHLQMSRRSQKRIQSHKRLPLRWSHKYKCLPLRWSHKYKCLPLRWSHNYKCLPLRWSHKWVGGHTNRDRSKKQVPKKLSLFSFLHSYEVCMNWNAKTFTADHWSMRELNCDHF